MTYSGKNLQLLIIEDNAGDYVLIEEYLKEEVQTPSLVRARTFKEASEALAGQPVFDAILLDLSLPDMSGEELVEHVLKIAGQIPVILLTGYSDKEFGINTLALGVTDYLLKDELTAYQLYKSVAYSRERKRIEQSLKQSNERYEIVAKATSDTIWDLDIVNDRMQYNNGIHEMFGYTLRDIARIGDWWKEKLHPEDLERVTSALAEMYENGKNHLQIEYRFRCADGSYKYILDRGFLITGEHGEPLRMIGAMQDITEQMKHMQAIEEQNVKLKEIAWTQSHVVRAPLARIMGIVELFNLGALEDHEAPEYLNYILSSAIELDGVIRSIVIKAASTEDPPGGEAAH